VPPGIDGNVLLYNGSAGTIQVIADVEGYYLGADRAGAGVWVWGDNTSGQLGDGTTTASLLPEHVSGLDNVIAVVQGFQRVTALRADGTVWEWGDRDFANGGEPPTVLTEHPVQVPGLSGITAIADSSYSGYALSSDGTEWAWGYNNIGQLGDGTRTTHLTPEQIPGLTGVVAISATMGDTAYAVKSDGTLWSWGYGGSGELGIGAVDNSNSPLQVSLTGVVGTAGQVALRSDGTVWAWGRDFSGEAGQGTSGSDVLTPVQVHNLSGVTAIAQTDKALTADGFESAWGSNDVGDLGIGSLTHSDLPVRVGGLSHVIALGDGYGAVTADGTAWNWGFNGYHAVGDGSDTQPVESPVRVAGLAGVSGVGNDEFNGFAVIPGS
jgi:alpha-tubulin suppressor-like RCC1 family protein